MGRRSSTRADAGAVGRSGLFVELQSGEVTEVVPVEGPKPRTEGKGAGRDREIDLPAAGPTEADIEPRGSRGLRRPEGHRRYLGVRGFHESEG